MNEFPRPGRTHLHIVDPLRDPRFVRPPHRVCGGICALVANRLDISVTLVRVILVVALLTVWLPSPSFVGIVLLSYAIAWLVFPEPDGRIHLESTLDGHPPLALFPIVILILSGFPMLFADQWVWGVILVCGALALGVYFSRHSGRNTRSSTPPPSHTTPPHATSAAPAQRPSAPTAFAPESTGENPSLSSFPLEDAAQTPGSSTPESGTPQRLLQPAAPIVPVRARPKRQVTLLAWAGVILLCGALILSLALGYQIRTWPLIAAGGITVIFGVGALISHLSGRNGRGLTVMATLSIIASLPLVVAYSAVPGNLNQIAAIPSSPHVVESNTLFGGAYTQKTLRIPDDPAARHPHYRLSVASGTASLVIPHDTPVTIRLHINSGYVSVIGTSPWKITGAGTTTLSERETHASTHSWKEWTHSSSSTSYVYTADNHNVTRINGSLTYLPAPGRSISTPYVSTYRNQVESVEQPVIVDIHLGVGALSITDSLPTWSGEIRDGLAFQKSWRDENGVHMEQIMPGTTSYGPNIDEGTPTLTPTTRPADGGRETMGTPIPNPFYTPDMNGESDE